MEGIRERAGGSLANQNAGLGEDLEPELEILSRALDSPLFYTVSPTHGKTIPHSPGFITVMACELIIHGTRRTCSAPTGAARLVTRYIID